MATTRKPRNAATDRFSIVLSPAFLAAIKARDAKENHASNGPKEWKREAMRLLAKSVGYELTLADYGKTRKAAGATPEQKRLFNHVLIAGQRAKNALRSGTGTQAAYDALDALAFTVDPDVAVLTPAQVAEFETRYAELTGERIQKRNRTKK